MSFLSPTSATTVTNPNPPAGTAFYRVAVKPGSFRDFPAAIKQTDSQP